MPLLRALGRTPRIAVIRGGRLGDFLSITPALRAVRGSLPQARIDLLVPPSLGSLARRYQGVDRVVPLPAYSGVCEGPVDPRSVVEFLARVRAEGYDLVLQWNGGGVRSNDLVRRMGAAVTAGYRSAGAPPLDYWLPWTQMQHEVLRWLTLAMALGAPPRGLKMEFPLAPGDLAELRSLDGALDLAALERGRYVGLHVGARAGARRWPPERFGAVGRALLETFPTLRLVVTAGAGEEDLARAALSGVGRADRVDVVAEGVSLGGMAALIAQLRLLVSNDTGPAHLAEALGTPSVVVFGSGHPANWRPLDTYRHRAVADWSAPCRGVGFRCGCADDSSARCLQGVSVDAVLAEARRLLARDPPRTRRARRAPGGGGRSGVARAASPPLG